MVTQGLTENALLAGVRNSNNKEDCMKTYEKWAATYNNDLADPSQNYVAPLFVAETTLAFGFDSRSKPLILDAGCGTGLVGEYLAKAGPMIIDGIDLSSHMLKEAERIGVYRDLILGDLTETIDKPNEAYDIVTCCGTFTHGHVGPDPALREFVRVIKKKGIVVATILQDLWLSKGFKAEVEKLEAERLVRVLSMELKDYRKGQSDKAIFIVLEKI